MNFELLSFCLQQHLVPLGSMKSGYRTGGWVWWQMYIPYVREAPHTCYRRSSVLKAWIEVSWVRPCKGEIFHTISVVPPSGNRSYRHHILFVQPVKWCSIYFRPLFQPSATTDNLAMICLSVYRNWMCKTPSALFWMSVSNYFQPFQEWFDVKCLVLPMFHFITYPAATF